MPSAANNPLALRRAVATARPDAVELGLRRTLTARPGVWVSPRQLLGGRNSHSVLSPNAHPYPPATSRALAEYLAKLALLHASDSWVFLARGLHAYAMGSAPIAMHLLYYSELRSAQSILARHGIGVFNKNPLAVTGLGRTVSLRSHMVNSTTHQGTWAVYDAWVHEMGPQFLADVVRVSSNGLGSWVSALNNGKSVSAIAIPLLLKWGMDLKQLVSDRELRNAVSYEPTRMAQAERGTSPSSVQQLLASVWSLLEPGSPNAFESFDRHLLRLVLDVGLKPGQRSAQVDSLLANAGVSAGANGLAGFLKRETQTSDPLVLARLGVASPSMAGATEADLDPICGRALLLARLAIGSCSSLLRDSGVSNYEVAFWLDDLLATFGLEGGPPSSYVDTWDQIENALIVSEGMHVHGGSAGRAHLLEWGETISVLTSLERVPSWSFS